MTLSAWRPSAPSGAYLPDCWLIRPGAPKSYFDRRMQTRPGTTTRRVWDHAPYSGVCSTDFNFIDVTLPAVSILSEAA